MTLIDSPTLSVSSSPAEAVAFVEAVSAQLSAQMGEVMLAIIRDGIRKWKGNIGDPAVFDHLSVDWQRFIDEVVIPATATMFDAARTVKLVVAAGELPPIWSQEAVAWAERSAGAFAKIGQDAAAQLPGMLASALREGQSPAQLAAQLRDQLGLGETQAMTIARTEMMSAFARGDRISVESDPEDQQPAEHVWLAVMDQFTRDSHAEAHEQVQAFWEPFQVGGWSMMHPHDPGAPPEETVNCRCVEAYLYPGDTRPDGSIVPDPSGPGDEQLNPDEANEFSPEGMDMPKSLQDHFAGAQFQSGHGLMSAGSQAKQMVAEDLAVRMGDQVRPGGIDKVGDSDNIFMWRETRHRYEYDQRYSTWLHEYRATGATPDEVDAAWRKFSHLRGLDSQESTTTREFLRGTDEQIVPELRKGRVSDLVHNWSVTSNDEDPTALAMQELAEEEFGLPSGASWRISDEDRATVDRVKEERGDELRAFLRAQYERTQEEFASLGVDEVTLYRGFQFSMYDDLPEWVENGTYSVPLRPMSAFTWDRSIADGFAEEDYGNLAAVIKGTVPVDHIIGTPLTGFGCLHEHEMVVLNGGGTWTVEVKGRNFLEPPPPIEYVKVGATPEMEAVVTKMEESPLGWAGLTADEQLLYLAWGDLPFAPKGG